MNLAFRVDLLDCGQDRMTIRMKNVRLACLLFLLPWGLMAVTGRAASLSSRWQLIPGSPAGARAISAVHETIYVGTPQGVFRSRSADGAWELLSNLNVKQLVPAPGDASKIYAIADVAFGPIYRSSWLYETSDAGDTWAVSLREIRSVVVDPFVPDVAYAAQFPFDGLAQGGVYKTSDGGATWPFLSQDFACVGPQPAFCYLIPALTINPREPLELYAFEEHEQILYKSRDGGMTWSPRYSGAGSTDLIVVDPITPLNVYARWHTDTFPDAPQILRTTDGGQTWTLLIVDGYAAGPLAIDPGTGTIFLAMPAGLLRSDDQGHHWTDVSGGLDGLPVSSLAFDGEARLYAGTGVGIFVLPLIERSSRSRSGPRAVPWR
jgi:hypothetical protein